MNVVQQQIGFPLAVPLLADAAASRPTAVPTAVPTPAPVGLPATQPAPSADAPPAGFGLLSNPIILIPIVLLLTTVLFGNKGKAKGEEKARTEALKLLKKGDRVQTTGGVLGAVVRVEEHRVEVKVDESNNVKIWFARGSIYRVVDGAAAAAADKADAK